MEIEYLVWGTRQGDEPWQEELLRSGCLSLADADGWKRYAEQDGFVNVRISKLNLSVPPDFVNAIAK